MKNFFMSTLAVFFPWVIMLMEDDPGGALFALILQATVIGWIPASIWALRVVREKRKKTKRRKKREEEEE